MLYYELKLHSCHVVINTYTDVHSQASDRPYSSVFRGRMFALYRGQGTIE